MRKQTFVTLALLLLGAASIGVAQDWLVSAPAGKRILVDNPHFRLVDVAIPRARRARAFLGCGRSTLTAAPESALSIPTVPAPQQCVVPAPGRSGGSRGAGPFRCSARVRVRGRAEAARCSRSKKTLATVETIRPEEQIAGRSRLHGMTLNHG